MIRWSFASRDPEQTRTFARELGRSIGAEGLVIALIGPLGAGKTVFVKGLAEGLGVEPRAVSSPTFVIAQAYRVPSGPDWLHHVDLYRLASEEELEGIGFDDLLAPGGVLAVEWADRFPGVLGRDVLRVEIEGPGSVASAPRDIRVEAEACPGGLAHRVARDWQTRVERFERRKADGADGEGTRGDEFALLLIAGLTALGTARDVYEYDPVDRSAESPAYCQQLEPGLSGETDSLGTRWLRCGDEPEPAASLPGSRAPHVESSDIAHAGIEGVARLLAGGKLDVGVATARQLQALPGIGPRRAEALVAYRADHPLERPAALEAVPGIGPGIRRRLDPWLAFPAHPARDETPPAHGSEPGSAGEIAPSFDPGHTESDRHG